jgi:hypothetical protein
MWPRLLLCAFLATSFQLVDGVEVNDVAAATAVALSANVTQW